MRSRRRNAPNVPTSLHRSASASNRRFSLPEKLRRLAIATTSGSRRAASGETISPVALRAPSATVSPEEPDNPSKEDFNNEVMCMSYLYSKLPETGVSPHIDTGGEVRALKPGETVWDAGVAGFGARRQQSSAVSYVLIYRTEEGRQRWHTIGRHGAPWTPGTAREEATRLLGKVADGIDPSAVKQA